MVQGQTWSRGEWGLRPPEVESLLDLKGATYGAKFAHLGYCLQSVHSESLLKTRMWANAQRDGRPAEYRWRPLFNAAKFG